MPQFRVLVVLDGQGPLRMGDLAERVGVHPSTLSRTVDKLVGAGWLERASGEESRREVHVALTNRGHKLVNEITAQRRSGIVGVLEVLTPADRAAVQRGMEIFATAAGEASPADLLELRALATSEAWRLSPTWPHGASDVSHASLRLSACPTRPPSLAAQPREEACLVGA